MELKGYVFMLIAVAHQKGGCSKTTLAINLAIEMNVTDCFDLDLAKGGTTGISFLSKLRKAAGHPILNVTPINNKNDLMKCIAADSDDRLMIMDLGGLDSDVNRIALAYADLVITPASDSSLEIGGLVEFSRMLEEIGKHAGHEITAHVIAARTNYARKKWPVLESICSKHSNLIFSGVAMPLYVDFVDASAEGQSVVEYNPKGNAAKHMLNVIKHIKSISF